MGRIPAAIADLEALKRTDPTALGLEPRVFLARLHMQAGRNDEWVGELESIVNDAPESGSHQPTDNSPKIFPGQLPDRYGLRQIFRRI